MGINSGYACAAFLLIATLAPAAEMRFWKHGRLISVEKTTSIDQGERRYECVVSDGTFSYTLEYEHPIKIPNHSRIKFSIETIKDTLIFLDADGKERPAHIGKRERVLLDPPRTSI